jgi:hypothetical protein
VETTRSKPPGSVIVRPKSACLRSPPCGASGSWVMSCAKSSPPVRLSRRPPRSALDCAGAVAARVVVARALDGPQAPRALACRGRGPRLLYAGVGPSSGTGTAVGRALHRRWAPARSLGRAEALQAASDRHAATHASTTEPAARLYKQARGQAATRCDLGPVLMEHRHGLVVDTHITQATGTAEREAARAMAEAIPGPPRVTLGADQHDDTRDVVRERRVRQVTPPVAHHPTGRSSAIDGRTTRHPGDAFSPRQRQGVEEIFGWRNTVGLVHKTRPRGVARVGWLVTFAAAVYKVVRMRTRGARHAPHRPHRASLAHSGRSTPQGIPTIRPFPRLNFC